MKGAQPVEWVGRVIAVDIHGQDGDYLAPPIVFDVDEKLVMGAQVLSAIAESGQSIEHPSDKRGVTPADLPALEQHLAKVSETLGLPQRTI